jgi:ankyrin repeat protein
MSTLKDAINKWDLDNVILLLKSGHKYNETGPSNLLFKFVRKNMFDEKYVFHMKAIKYCVKNLKIDINSINKNGETLLYLATITRNKNIIQKLIKLGADPNFINKTTEYYSSDDEEYTIINSLPRNKPFCPLAYLLCQPKLTKNSIEIIKILMKHGARLDIKNDFGQNLLELVNQSNLQYAIQV